jgi:hypothetical protein
MDNQFQLHKILTAFGVFMLGYSTMTLDFNNLSWANNQMPFSIILVSIAAIALGMFLQRKQQ